jgi:glutaredoxin-like protein
MSIIEPKDRDFLEKEFAAKLTGPVKLVMVTQEHECQFCKETREIVQELAELSDKITAEIYDFVADEDTIAPYGIARIPAIAVIGAKDYGIRLYGIPSGYEFSSLIQTILMVSGGESGLKDATKKALAELKQDLHVQVFGTPT